MPNILRALIFDDDAGECPRDRVAVVSFDIDDMTGEELAEAADRIRNCCGVLDVTMTMAVGKKGRPLACFRVLAREDALHAVRLQCLQQTSTLGLRWRTRGTCRSGSRGAPQRRRPACKGGRSPERKRDDKGGE